PRAGGAGEAHVPRGPADLHALLALERRVGKVRHGDRVEMRAAGARHAITSPSMPGSGSGSFGSRRSSGSTRRAATAVLLTQFRSAGTTCHGAHSVDVS